MMLPFVIPAETQHIGEENWIPAYAGMTMVKA